VRVTIALPGTASDIWQRLGGGEVTFRNFGYRPGKGRPKAIPVREVCEKKKSGGPDPREGNQAQSRRISETEQVCQFHTPGSQGPRSFQFADSRRLSGEEEHSKQRRFVTRAPGELWRRTKAAHALNRKGRRAARWEWTFKFVRAGGSRGRDSGQPAAALRCWALLPRKQDVLSGLFGGVEKEGRPGRFPRPNRKGCSKYAGLIMRSRSELLHTGPSRN